ncbi:hypothetical protein DRQ33_06585 [bacterium]|nr:MAG: hypothetical protein DRQ33_06585 [bacterium]
MGKWRLIDTGILSAAENMAWDRALLLAQAENEGQPILRFLQFSPACVLVGRHQSPSQEVRLEYIKSNGFDINRRITGGGAIFFDPSQIGWEVFANYSLHWAKCSHSQLYRKISAGVIEALKKLGISANFRPRNDIEVDGRKISGTGGASEDNAFMFQGTLLMDNVAEKMLYALRVPAEKLGRHGLESISERVVFLNDLIGPRIDHPQIKQAIIKGFEEVFDVEIIQSTPTLREYELYSEILPYMNSAEWIYRIDKPEESKGILTGISRRKGTVRCSAHIDIDKNRISSVQFWGDFFIQPARAINDLEALLKHCRAKPQSIIPMVRDFFKRANPHLIGVKEENFEEALYRAVSRVDLLKQGFSFQQANRIYSVNVDMANWTKFPFSHFLFPYCSKLVGCKFRHKKDCPQCAGCTVGEGYELAQQCGLEPITITSFASLMRTHRKLRKENFPGYIGSCCEEFFVKHMSSFKNSGLGIILIRVDSTTCYDLSQQRAAYRGDFESQTELDLNLIEKVLSMWDNGQKSLA